MLPVCRRKYDIFPASGKFNPHLRKAPQNGKLTPRSFPHHCPTRPGRLVMY